MDYRKEIDGLRALAVLPVIFNHAGFELFSGGFVGVDIFFVISGYLITTILLSELTTGTFSLSSFWERRARRILPALFFVMFVCLPFAWLYLMPSDMKRFSASAAAVSVFISNHLFANQVGYFDADASLKPLLHTWSLAVEEQFYLVFPLFLCLLWKFSRKWIFTIFFILAAISLFAADYYSAKNSAVFYLLPARAWELLMGAMIARHLQIKNNQEPKQIVSEIASLIGVILIFFAIFTFNNTTPFPGLYSLVPTIGASLIILFSTTKTFTGKFLANKYLIGVGLLSYSLYLWHQPIFSFARHQSLNEPSKFVFILLILVSFIFSYGSWRFVEGPFRVQNKITKKQILFFSILVSLFFLVFGYFGKITDGAFGRNYSESFDLIQKVRLDRGKNNNCGEVPVNLRTENKACEVGISGELKSFAVIGDSHAGSLIYQLDVLAKKNNLSGYNYTLSSCPPLLGGSSFKQGNDQLTCNEFRKYLFEKIARHELPRTLIVSARWAMPIEKKRFDNKEGGIEKGDDGAWGAPNFEILGYQDSLKKSYIESINFMLNSGYKIILIYPWPEMGWNVPNRLSKLFLINNRVTSSDASVSYGLFKERTKLAYIALDSIEDHPNLLRIKPERKFCNTIVNGRCIAHINMNPLYYDDDHLSSAGAALVIEDVINLIK